MNKYDEFIASIAKLPDAEKQRLSDTWCPDEGGDEATATLGSAVWTTIRISDGKGFQERAIRFLTSAGVDDPQGELDEFIRSFG